MQGYQWLHAQIQHQVEGLAERLRLAPEINRTGHLADSHAVTVRFAFAGVDLVAEVDCAFRANGQTGIAARAQIQVNRIGFVPGRLKRAQPALECEFVAADHRVLALLQGKPGLRLTGNALRKNRHLQRVSDQRSHLFGLIHRADDEQPTRAFVGHGGHWFSVRQMSRRQQSSDLGHGARSVLAPATGFTDIDKLDH